MLAEPGENDAIATLVLEGQVEGIRSQPGEEGSRNIELREGQTLRVGRAENNDLVIRNKRISRYHAVFTASSCGVVLCDLSSLNGTFVNGVRIGAPMDLGSGDIVAVGDLQLRVRLGGTVPLPNDSLNTCTVSAQFTSVIVTVLLVDVCRYTILSANLPGEDVARMLDLWFRRSAEIIVGWGGGVDKYIGDCVMALWKGTRATAGDAALQAVGAAQEIMAETIRLSASKWPHHNTYSWSCRAALNTGEALIGSVGATGRREFTALGDTVNIAFRLEENAQTIGTDFVLSSSTADLIRPTVDIEDLGELRIPGRTDPIDVATVCQKVWLPRNLEGPRAKSFDKMLALPAVAEALKRIERDVPERYCYHSLLHTERVLNEALMLAEEEGFKARELELLALAAAYHDIGFIDGRQDHEERGAEHVRRAMEAGRFSPEEIALVCSMILDTRITEGSRRGEPHLGGPLSGCLLDADLANIGQADFFLRFGEVQRESGRSWAEELRHVLALLENHSWNTAAARRRYDDCKKKNLAAIRGMAQRLASKK